MYRPGETVRGKVIAVFESDQHPRSVTLHAIGTEFTNWGTQPTYVARTHPLDQAIELWRPRPAAEVLRAGTHDFPFAIGLPARLPPTFDGMLTEIGYGLRAKVDLPRHVDLHAEKGFAVLAIVPALAEAPAPVTAHDTSGRELTLELPRSTHRLGQTFSGCVHLARPGEGRSRRLTLELLSCERGSAQGVWAEHVEREADLRVELEHVTDASTFSFSFQVPDSAMPTFCGDHCELTWRVAARLDVARGHDLVAEAEVIVVEAE